MQPDFEYPIARQKYFAAVMAVFKSFFHQRPRQNSVNGITARPIADHPTSLDHRNIYQDPDPPTPHWGC
jgi:hypothetical protein